MATNLNKYIYYVQIQIDFTHDVMCSSLHFLLFGVQKKYFFPKKATIHHHDALRSVFNLSNNAFGSIAVCGIVKNRFLNNLSNSFFE